MIKTTPQPDADALPTTLGARLPRKDEQAKPAAPRRVRPGVVEVDGKLHTELELPPLPGVLP